MASLVMDQRVVWNSTRLKEIDEAKRTIVAYKRKGHKIVLPDGSPMLRFNANLEEVIIKAERVVGNILRILNEKGDERLAWDKDHGFEAMEAKEKFKELLNKGYIAYSVNLEGKKKNKIEEFDVDAEEILMVPPTMKG